MKYAVQLYSLRDMVSNGDDFLKILEEVKKLGFDGVEFAGYHGLSAETIKAKLDELGLVPVGCHIGVDNFEDDKIEETVKFHKTLGVLNVGTGGAPHDTVEECERAADLLAKGSAALGVPAYYHNHTEEFTPLENGKTAMQVFAEKVKLELDTYWSFCAGIDNYKYITENINDIILLHIKDGIDGKPMALTEGNNDLDAVIRAAKDNNIEWVILENDDPVPNGLEDVTRSMKYLQSVK